MSGFSEEAVRQLKEHVENLVAEMGKLTPSFAKLESQLAIPKKLPLFCQKDLRRQKDNVGSMLNTHGQNAWKLQECLHQYNQLEDSVCKIFDKLSCNVVTYNLDNCHCLKGDRVIVKSLRRKDCKQVLSVKNDLKNTNMVDFGFEGHGSN